MADGVGGVWIAETGADGVLGGLGEIEWVEGIGWAFFHGEAPESTEPQSGICMPRSCSVCQNRSLRSQRLGEVIWGSGGAASSWMSIGVAGNFRSADLSLRVGGGFHFFSLKINLSLLFFSKKASCFDY